MSEDIKRFRVIQNVGIEDDLTGKIYTNYKDLCNLLNKESEKAMTVAELREWLNGISDDCSVKVSLYYDNCEHIQNLNDVYAFNNWLILCGKVKD